MLLKITSTVDAFINSCQNKPPVLHWVRKLTTSTAVAVKLTVRATTGHESHYKNRDVLHQFAYAAVSEGK